MAELSTFGVGTAVANAETRTVGKSEVSTVTLAFNRSFKKGDDWVKEPCFVKTQIWGNKAERLAKVQKGQLLYVTGYLKQDSWTAEDGTKRTSYCLNLRDFQLCEKNGKKPVSETSSESIPDTPF